MMDGVGLTNAYMGGVDDQVLRNGHPRTPSGPEGSSGSGNVRVPWGAWLEPPFPFCTYPNDVLALEAVW